MYRKNGKAQEEISPAAGVRSRPAVIRSRQTGPLYRKAELPAKIRQKSFEKRGGVAGTSGLWRGEA
jgi:hypothetical protein